MIDEFTVSWLCPDWPAPANVRAVCTSRQGGVSHAPYDTLNLATRTGDDRERVGENLARLKVWRKLTNEPVWLRQVHGASVIGAW